MAKTSNDRLAEYVRKKYPGIERSMDFAIWKTLDALKDIANFLKQAEPGALASSAPYEDPLEYFEGEWIPTDERLPDLNDDGSSDIVVLCWSDGQMTTGAYIGDRTFYGEAWPRAKDARTTVVAWMPLPEPYRKEDDE